jgi:hypothetical protein
MRKSFSTVQYKLGKLKLDQLQLAFNGNSTVEFGFKDYSDTESCPLSSFTLLDYV